MNSEIPEIPEQLIEAIVQGRVVLFAGAGVSRGQIETSKGISEQNLPSWGGLLIVLLERALDLGYISVKECAQLKKAVKEQKYLFVAETVRKKLGAREYDDALEDIFRNIQLRPTKRHSLITQIPFAAIVTTNYDKLLESAYAQQGYIPPTYAYDNSPDIISALSQNRFFILKAHGDIDRKNTIILSERDYRDIVYREPGYRAALNTIFITKTILFVGTSLTDTDVNLVLESVSEIFSGKGTRHYALVPKQTVIEEEIQHWRDFFGIKLLQYKTSKGHPQQVDGILEILKNKVEKKTLKSA